MCLPFSGEGNGTSLQYSCLENPMDGGAWWAAVHGVAKSRTWLSDFTFTFMHWRRKWQPTPVFWPGESQGRGAWWAAVYRVTQRQTGLKRLSSSSSLSQVIKVAPNCIFYWILPSNCVFVSHIFWLTVSPTKEAYSVPVWIYHCIFFYGISKSWTRLND